MDTPGRQEAGLAAQAPCCGEPQGGDELFMQKPHLPSGAQHCGEWRPAHQKATHCTRTTLWFCRESSGSQLDFADLGEGGYHVDSKHDTTAVPLSLVSLSVVLLLTAMFVPIFTFKMPLLSFKENRGGQGDLKRVMEDKQVTLSLAT